MCPQLGGAVTWMICGREIYLMITSSVLIRLGIELRKVVGRTLESGSIPLLDAHFGEAQTTSYWSKISVQFEFFSLV